MTPFEIISLILTAILGGLVVYFMGKIDARISRLEHGLITNSEALGLNTKAIGRNTENLHSMSVTLAETAAAARATWGVLDGAKKENDRRRTEGTGNLRALKAEDATRIIPREDPPSDKGGSSFRRSQPGER